ncbi:MAG TPA: HDOD domain-containing protein [Sedimentisphaerales bacterium]|nr:HDOD domain-containing protein [Sedimentisphaerales bacterium]
MTAKDPDPAARHVELVFRRLDSLSTLPCVASRFVRQLVQSQFSPSTLAETVESDPALSAKVLSLAHQHGLSFADEKPSVRRALDKLPYDVVRDALFSIKILQPFNGKPENNRMPIRSGLTLHCLAVACCARYIAEIVLPQKDWQMAYSAGLLHDIGKLALEEAMPKSFVRIVEEAKSQECSSRTVEQRRLGLDHTTLGKRLAQKWGLPEEITLAVWLHHSDTVRIAQTIAEAQIARIVQLADTVARQCGIGFSGSYDPTGSTEQVAEALSISDEQLEQIRRDLPGTVDKKSKALGLDLSNEIGTYCEVVHTAASQLAHDNSRLFVENRRLRTASSHFDFIKDFLSSIDSNSAPIEVAENFAVRWQKFYQTGMVCLYLVPPAGSQTLEAVVVETLARARTVYLKVPADSPVIPKQSASKFAILDAGDYVGWLFEQLDADFDLSQTKLLPIASNGKVIGAIVFELRYPGDIELFQENFRATACAAGSVLDMAFNWASQQHFAEQFAQLLTGPIDELVKPAAETAAKQVPPEGAPDSFSALAEIAGGAAHELNNPLSVISGRAQLLAESESDPEKKRILRQIQENSRNISQIINDLMTFAKPASPRPAQANIRQIIDEAIQLASQKTRVEHINVQTELADGLQNVFADSAQIVSAVANIICNSLESYTGDMGPIKIAAEAEESGGPVKLKISDLGRGMDAEALKKATQPFFSGRPAGRKRGMGLAHARRLIELNKGSLRITSRPGSGTTVTILLPRK